MAESTNSNIASLIRGIPKFDGNPSKYEDWKIDTKASSMSRNDMYEILSGESVRPSEVSVVSPLTSTGGTDAEIGGIATTTTSIQATALIKKRDKTNSQLYNVLHLTTSGAARCLLRRYESKNGKIADGLGA